MEVLRHHVIGALRRRTAWCLCGVTGLLAASVLSVIMVGSGVASAAPRDFDTTFGSAGTGIVQYSTSTGAQATGVAVVPAGVTGAGDIVVSTDGGGGSGAKFEVARFTTAGVIDTTFGTNGVLDATFAGRANAVAIEPTTGDIVAVGEEATGSATCVGQQPVVVVYPPTGSPSTTTPIACPAGTLGYGDLNAVTIAPNGNIVVAGQVLSSNGTMETLVAQLTSAGASVGSVTAQPIGAGNSAALGAAVSPVAGGDIFTTGYSYNVAGTRFLTVASFNPTTNAYGTYVTPPDAPSSIGNAIVAIPDGNVVAAGSVDNATTSANETFLAQYSSALAPVSGFGTQGTNTNEVINTPSLGSPSEYSALAYQPEGNVLVAAGSVLSGSSEQMLVGQYNATTGVPNQLFGGSSGGLNIPFAAGASSLAAVAVQTDGKAVVAGDAPSVNSAPSIGLVRIQVPAPRPYSPLPTPTRICDTRTANPSGLTGLQAQCNGHTITGGTSLTVSVAGEFGVPTNATAVVVNVTAVNPVNGGYLTVYPPGTPPPTTTTLNVTMGQVVGNLAEVALSGGHIDVFSSVTSDVVIDLEGYTSPTAAGGVGAGLYQPLSSPTRVCDTRANNPSSLTGPAAQCNGPANAGMTIPAGGRQKVQIAGDFTVPSNATAVVANLTAVSPSSGGFLTAYPDGSSLPTASNVNYSMGQVIPNRVIVPLGADGAIDLYSYSPSNVVLDLAGYYTAAGGSGSGFVAETTPVRACDTRAGNPSGLGGVATQCNGKTLQAGATLSVQIAGQFGVPASAKAVVLNVAAVDPTVSGSYLTVYGAAPRPTAADLNPPRGGIEPNLVVSTLSSSGMINVFNAYGAVDVVVDVEGWYQ